MDYLKRVQEWAEKAPEEAVIRLMAAGLCSRAAEKMVNGTYKHRLRRSTIRRINAAMNGIL